MHAHGKCRQEIVGSDRVILSENNKGLYKRRTQENRNAAWEFAAALKECSKTRDFQGGKKLHSDAVTSGCHTDKFVASALINMYIKCGSIQQAKEVFDNTIHRDAVTWNSLMMGYVENGESSLALDLYTRMSFEPTRVTYIAALKACACLATERASMKDIYLEKGSAIHRELKDRGFLSCIFVRNTLIDMYGKCGSMQSAREVFDTATHQDVVTWNCLLMGYVENGESSSALELFESMDCEPNHVTYIAALKACTCLKEGIAIHEQLKARGYGTNRSVANSLVVMYGKCGSMQYAWEVFESMTYRDVVAWNCLIGGYVENGEYSVAIEFFNTMDCKPDHVTYVAALKACAGLATERDAEKHVLLEKGIAMHRRLKEQGFAANVFVANTLLDMYGKCGCMQLARKVFDNITHRDVVSWNTLILGYVENGESSVGLDLFFCMDSQPDSFTYVAALKACANMSCLAKGIVIHKHLRDHGFSYHIHVRNALLEMYMKCGSLLHAQEVFDDTKNRDVATWNTLILGYVENGESLVALEIFTRMNCKRTRFTYIAALKACASLGALKKAVSIHQELKECGYQSDIMVENTLVYTYGKMGNMQHAKDVFDNMLSRDVVTWNSLILGYVENGESSVALDLFARMDCKPSYVTYLAALKACVGKHCLEKGIAIHKQLKDYGVHPDLALTNTLLDMYCKCGSMHHAQETFDLVLYKDVVTWNSLILGYVENGESPVAIEYFTIMDCEPDCVTYLAVLKACGNILTVPYGEYIHRRVCKQGVEHEQGVANALVSFYGKCGRMDMAEELVSCMSSPDIVSWTALIAGYSSCGDSYKVFSVVEKIQEAGLRMNSVTFTCVLAACNHAGLVYKGKMCFKAMVEDGIQPDLEHYNCILDMLGRVNKLEEALYMVESMPFEGDVYTWTCLLGACRKWKNVEVGKVAFDALVSENEENAAAYVMMRDIYGSSSTYIHTHARTHAHTRKH